MTSLATSRDTVQMLDCGDSAVRVAVDAEPDAAWRLAHGIAAVLDAVPPAGFHGALPTYDAVLIEFDCTLTDHTAIRAAVREALDQVTDVAPRSPRTFTVPVAYGGEHGPDLQATATLLGLTADEVVAIHSATPLLMRCFGSPAGAPMLDGPAFSRPIPRRASPRAHVPPGAVAVAGRQAVVSTRPAPGGWQVLGTTPLTLVDPDRDPLTAYWPGDWFRFVPISADAFAANRGVLE